MENIIITISKSGTAFSCDIEVPTDLAGLKLKTYIVEALNGYNPSLFLNAATIGLYSNRTNRIVPAAQTLEEAGVWNGDYITIIEV